MKKNFRFLASFMLFLTTLTSAMGQNTQQNDKPVVPPFNEPQGYLTLGLDVGLSYQSSDVKSAFGGYGLGLTLEKNLKHTEGSALDFGVRGRLMYARSSGYSLTASNAIDSNAAVNGVNNAAANYKSVGSFFPNYRTNQAELGIEGVLTLNRLREKTGVYATLFGGFGMDYYDVKVDQLDASGKKYNYSTLKPTTIADVKSFLDGTFETKADGFTEGGKLEFLPNFGIELGYHFSPRFMVVFGHKVTIAKDDLLDGQRWLEKTTLSARPDFHQYTNLQFKWIIGERKNQHLDGDPPKITFLQPRLSPYNTYDATERIRAEVLGATFQEDITLTVNGLQTNFIFKNNELTADVFLNKGQNEIVVKAENQFGSNNKKQIIKVLDKQRVPDAPLPGSPTNNNGTNNNTPNNNNTNTPTAQSPRVKFMTPSAAYIETSQDRQAIRVQVSNIGSGQDITMNVNGRNVTDFRFSGGELMYDVPLNEGNNSISVSATNMSGSSTDAVTVNYRRPVQPVNAPVVRINSTGTPTENAYGGCQTTLDARVDNVIGQRDITLTLNGRATTDFNYNATSHILRANISLASGSNQVVITARNTDGQGSDRADINCSQRQRITPIVRITQPSNNSNTDQNVADVRATTTNIDTKNQIEVYVNGYQTSDFNFSTYDKSVTLRMNLNEGDNTVRIRVTNNDGSNEDIVHTTYRSRAVSNPPRVTIVSPINGATSRAQTVDLQANATGITDRSQIQMTLNYKTVQAFNFDANTGVIAARMNLDAGTNTIKVIVSNPSGSDAATTSVNYNAATIPPTTTPTPTSTVRPPRVTITRPADGATVTTPSVLLEGQVENASSARGEVKVIVNGAETAGTVSLMRVLRQMVTLKEGVNSITVRAVTKDGTDEKTIQVTYNKPIATDGNTGLPLPSRTTPPTKGKNPIPATEIETVKPTITNFNVTQPVTDPFDPKPLVSVVTATITKVPKAYIQFTINGEEIKTFDFDATTGQLRYSFGVKGGQSYTFYIKAANIEGDAEMTQTVKF